MRHYLPYECTLSTDNFPRSRKTFTFSASLLLLTTAVWLSACATVSVNSSWQAGAPRNKTFSKLLVVGVSPNRDLRCTYESIFASQLKSASTTVFTSCSLMATNQPFTRETVERAAASVHADAVLATRLVSATSGQGEGGSNDTRGDARYKATDFGYGAYGMPVTELEFQTAPPITSLTNSIHVVTKLYETSDAALLYTIDTKTKAQEVDSTEATLISITAPTADRLRREHLIR